MLMVRRLEVVGKIGPRMVMIILAPSKI